MVCSFLMARGLDRLPEGPGGQFADLLSNRTGKLMATQAASSMQISEESLIRAGQRGQAQALNTLFRRHHKSLYHLAPGVMGNPEDAEDALQDGLLSAFRSLKSFEGRSQFSTWLTRIRNKRRSHASSRLGSPSNHGGGRTA
jgi:hypothetical protein